jgi:hypothetical protein
MSKVTSISSIPKPAAVALDGTEPFPPEQIVEQLRVLRTHIPDFEPLPNAEAASLRRAANVDDDLVQAAANTVGASKFVASALGKTADDLRLEREGIARWSAVEHEVETLFKGVVSSNLVRRHRLGMASLQAYLITRQLVRQEIHADLRPHVEAMRRANKFTARRRTAPDAAAKPPVLVPPVTPKV